MALPPVVNAALIGPVPVTGGTVTGAVARDASVSVFRGIPYAAPPLQDLRWKAPAPVAPWPVAPGPTAPGNDAGKADTVPGECIHPGNGSASGTEDCLYLAVWTAARAAGENRPVAVFLPGPEGISGLDGEALASRGVVVVIAQSRSGLMGFLAHPDLSEESEKKASGNYGLLDQFAVLEWVRGNIAGFGGDSRKVTVAGPSVAWLAGSPLAKGMFAGAIASAFASGEAVPLAEAEKAGEKFALSQNAHSMRYLRPMDAGDLIQATLEERYEALPAVDGSVLQANWRTALPEGVAVLAAAGEWAGAVSSAGKNKVFRWLASPDLDVLKKILTPGEPATENPVGYWINFITNGDPNGKGLPTWTAGTPLRLN